MSTALALTENSHKKGCKGDRIEVFEATRPSTDLVSVVRCMDCGESEVHEQPLKEFMKVQTEEKPEKGNSNGK